jgi:tripartite-type tricarboxylate transporter receptor subunit TctC
MKKKSGILMVLGVSLGLLFPQVTQAQAYPTKPIEVVVPWGAGVSIDIVARIIADLSTKYLSQPMVVVNKPGATGSMGAADVIGSKPDGYKLYTNGHGYFANTINTQKLPFDPFDLVPLAGFVELRQCMVVRGDSDIKTFSDLLAYAKKNPGQLKWGHGGRGITYHITPLLIFRREGVSTIDIPFKGGGSESNPALLGGHVDALSGIYLTMLGQIESGKFRVLVWYSDHRFKDTPNIPHLGEIGYQDLALPAFQAYFIHKKTPEHMKKILMDAFKKIYDDPEFKTKVAKINVDPMWVDADEVGVWIEKSEAIAIPILKELGLYVGR